MWRFDDDGRTTAAERERKIDRFEDYLWYSEFFLHNTKNLKNLSFFESWKMDESSYLISKKYGFVWVDSVLGCMKEFPLDNNTRGFFRDRGISVMVNLVGDFDVRIS